MFELVIAAAVAAAQHAPVVATTGSPRVVVEGTGSVKTAPDLARLSYNAHGEGRTSDQAISSLVAKATAIETALRSMDPSLDLHSNSVRVETVRGKDCRAERYDEGAVISTGACAIEGYVATQDFSARSTRVSDAGTMVGYAARHGASDPRIRGFDIADASAAKRQAIAAAMAEAKTKAQAIAEASNSRLGEIVSVSLDGARGHDIIVTGSRIPAASIASNAPITIAVTPEPVETHARVTVTYAIVR